LIQLPQLVANRCLKPSMACLHGFCEAEASCSACLGASMLHGGSLVLGSQFRCNQAIEGCNMSTAAWHAHLIIDLHCRLNRVCAAAAESNHSNAEQAQARLTGVCGTMQPHITTTPSELLWCIAPVAESGISGAWTESRGPR
jgi:hypothetical protein